MHMCIVIQSMAQQFEPSVRPDKAHSIELRRLLAEARAVRRARQSVESRVGGPSVIAAKTLDQVLSSAMPARIDVASYVSRVATLAQLSERTIGSLMTAITPEPMPSAWVRSLAVALVEMFHFVAVGVIEPDLLSLQLAVGRDGNRLIVGIAAIDRFSPSRRPLPLADCYVRRASSAFWEAHSKGALTSAGWFWVSSSRPPRLVIGKAIPRVCKSGRSDGSLCTVALPSEGCWTRSLRSQPRGWRN